MVATEVRRLADQTAVATYDIEQMVREIQSAGWAGGRGMAKFSEEVRRANGQRSRRPTQVGEAIIERAVRQRSMALSAQTADQYWQQLQASTDEQQALIEAVIVPETW